MRSSHLLTLLRNLCLLSNIFQSTNHLLIPIRKSENSIRDLHIFTELLEDAESSTDYGEESAGTSDG